METVVYVPLALSSRTGLLGGPQQLVDNLSIIDIFSLGMLQEPLSNHAAKKLIAEILKTGTVSIDGHAYKAMEDDNLTEIDVQNVLRGGWVEFSEYERRSWRYRVRTQRIWVVVAFRSETHLVVVTVWRKQ